MKRNRKIIITCTVIVLIALLVPVYLQYGERVFDNSKTEVLLGEEADTYTAISTTNFPVEMSADEMLEKAKAEGFVVFEDFHITSGEEVWQKFYETTQAGETAIVYLANYYTLNKESMSEELYEQEKEEYPRIGLSSLYFDGQEYVVVYRSDEGELNLSKSYPYLVKFEGKPSSVTAVFDSYVYYVLVHDKNVTWKELEWGMLSSQLGDYIDHYRVYTNHISD